MRLWKGRLDQLPGGLDDLQEAAGDLEIAEPSGASHLKSSCSSFRTGSRAVQRAANDMIT